jgi:hypothetical protein
MKEVWVVVSKTREKVLTDYIPDGGGVYVSKCGRRHFLPKDVVEIPD